MMLTLKQIVWATAIGIAAASIYTFYTKRVLGSFVRRLFEHDAFDKESAVPLEALGLKGLPFIKYSLREGTSFSRTVLCHDGKYYIPEERIDMAERKYCGERIPLLLLPILLLVLCFTALICNYLFPELFTMLGITA